MSNADREAAALATIPDVLTAAATIVRPLVDADAVKQAQKDYQSLCTKLLTPGDITRIGDGYYKNRSAYRKLSVAFGVTTELVSLDVARDDDGRILRATVIARAVAPNGRASDGIGVCAPAEQANMTHPEHDAVATAHTRAMNRACADLFGMGEVTAEEISGEPEGARRRKSPPISPADAQVLGEWLAELPPPIAHRVDAGARRQNIPEGGPTTVAGRDRMAWVILSSIPQRERPGSLAWAQPADPETGEIVRGTVTAEQSDDDPDPPDVETENVPRYDPDDAGRPFGND